MTIDEIIKENSKANISLFSKQGFTVTEIQVCEHCKGYGSVVESEFKGHSKGIEEQVVQCSNCLGSGRIKAHITIIRKPFNPAENDR